jgi:ATP-dependent Clp protease protease subunit
MLMEKGKLFLVDEINEKSTKRLLMQLTYLEGLDSVSDISLLICSNGGDVECGSAIVDKLEEVGRTKTITTIASGRCYSAGAIIFGHGQKRLAYKNACLMFHDCCYGLREDSHSKQKAYVDFTEKMYGLAITKMCENCKMSRRTQKMFLEKTKQEFWMTADEALKLGIVEKII